MCERSIFRIVILPKALMRFFGIIVFIPWVMPPGVGLAADFPSITGPCGLVFPRDHGAHPDYRTEWWYYTGNLHSESGERFGFQLTFFRVRTTPPGTGEPNPERVSAWRTCQIIAAHAALSDISGKVFLHSEKISRAALQLAGTGEDGDTFLVWLDDWMASISPDMHKLDARTPEFAFRLELAPLKRPALHGNSGYSLKGEGAGEASCYYSITRLRVDGRLSVLGREKRVGGTAWMDHEFSSAPLGSQFAGWDWFSLQLKDGSDLMIYLMRDKMGRFHTISSGTYIAKDGRVVHLSSSDFRIEPLKTWKSPHSGASYPSLWRIEVFPLDLRLTVEPNLDDQEMQSPESTRVTYWEGTVSAKGTVADGVPVTAEGYVELTGYAGDTVF